MKLASFLCYLLFVLSTSSGQVRHDLFVPVGAWDSLDATYYLPATPPPPAGYPAILFVHGFGLNKDWDTSNCYYYSAAGYLAMCFSVRGHGNSTGLSGIMGPQERGDLAPVISFLRGLPDVDTDRVGIVGGSQGGLHGLWAIADRLPVHAVSSDVIVPGWASDMLMNGCIRRTLLLLIKTNGVRYSTARDSLWDFLRTDAYDSLLARFPAGRDLDTGQLYPGTTPLLSLLKWQDHYFSAEKGLDLYNRYGSTKKLYAGTQGHFSDPADAERLYQSDQVTRWMNHFLKGEENGILDGPGFTYAFSSLPMDSAGYFTWTRTSTPLWPPDGVRPVRFYPGPDSMLTYVPPVTEAGSFRVDNLYSNSAYTFETGYIEGFTGPNMEAALPKMRVSFETLPLPNDLLLAGAPVVHLFINSGSTQFPLHTQIYEVDTAGATYFVARADFIARHWTQGATREIDVIGIPHTHRFHAGNRIRIEFTNIDRTNRKLLGEFPFVLPVFSTASATVYADRLHPSYVELPLMGSPLSVGTDADALPVSVRLEQNYPNPFNPATVIRYSLFVTGSITLKVYDLLGREVAMLVDGVREAGEHAVHWDASGVAPGIYLCRLTTPAANIGRKMIFLK
jgi:predicted acyl esterase